MKNLKLLLFTVFTTFPLYSHAQTVFRVMEYNVENLFDVTHDSLKADLEFLPTATRNWNQNRFWRKLIHLSQVISSAGEDQLPDLVMLCEVENDSTLIYLTKRSPLRVAGYDYLMTHSPDERGIDIALLYQRATFKPLSFEEIEIDKTFTGNRPTRNIFHITGQIQTHDTLDLFLCHMPSRSSGKKLTEPYRKHTAKVLREAVEKVNTMRKTPRIVITGDFNDEPKDVSLSGILGAGEPKDSIKPTDLYNLITGKKPGTYKYDGKWNTLDQFIVNGNLLVKESGHLYTAPEKVRIHQPAFLLEKDEKYGGFKPFRTYSGMRYLGGYSDHLPVVADFHW